MKKFILTIAATIMFCSTIQAQVVPMGHPKKSAYSHSNTIVTVYQQQQEDYWHFVVDASLGVHVYSGSHAVNPMIDYSASIIHESGKGFMLGATLGYGNFREKYNNSIYDYPELRIMGAIGCMFNSGPGSMFFLLQPGIGFEDGDFLGFSADAKLGYRYMIREHFGFAISSGITGTWGYNLAIPITLGIVF